MAIPHDTVRFLHVLCPIPHIQALPGDVVCVHSSGFFDVVKRFHMQWLGTSIRVLEREGKLSENAVRYYDGERKEIEEEELWTAEDRHGGLHLVR